MNKKEKEQLVKKFEDKFQKCTSYVFAEFRGLNVQRMEQLRKQSRHAQIEFQVIKNTLAKLASQSLKLEGTDSFFIGPTAVAFGWDDPITPIKVLSEFAKENPELILKGGIVEGTVVAKDKISVIARLPSKEVLLSQVLMQIQTPIRDLLNVLNGPIYGLINCLKAIEQKRS